MIRVYPPGLSKNRGPISLNSFPITVPLLTIRPSSSLKIARLFSSLIALNAWNQFNDQIQGLDDTIVYPETKAKIAEYSPVMLWGDKLFVALFVALLVVYLISCLTIPPEEPVYALIFAGILVLIVLFSMIFSNLWDYMINLSLFTSEVGDMTFTTFFMRFFPFIALFVGVAGGIIFYSRRNEAIGGISNYG